MKIRSVKTFRVIPADDHTKWFIGMYNGPEGAGRLAAVYDTSTDKTTMVVARGVAPGDFLEKAAAYMASKRIPLPRKS